MICAHQNENFTAETNPQVDEAYQLYPEEDVHGRDGPVQVSYPHYIYEQSGIHNLLYSVSVLRLC